MRLYSRDRTAVGVLWALGVALAIHPGAGAQVGQNINVITGSDSQFTGDMFRQRQTEPVGISSVCERYSYGVVSRPWVEEQKSATAQKFGSTSVDSIGGIRP